MRTVLFIALGSVAAFLASLAGTYVLMPMVAPGVVEAERMRADSLAAASLAADSVALGALDADSLRAADSLALTSAAPSLLPDGEASSADSLAALHERLAAYEAQIGALQSEVGATKAQRARAADLASTLIKLEDGDLARVLARLDLDVLTVLYTEASARDRARLLGALEPSRTALFVRRAAAASTRPSVAS